MLIAALKPAGWKGVSKLKYRESLAKELVASVGHVQAGMTVIEWVEKARAALDVDA